MATLIVLFLLINTAYSCKQFENCESCLRSKRCEWVLPSNGQFQCVYDSEVFDSIKVVVDHLARCKNLEFRYRNLLGNPQLPVTSRSATAVTSVPTPFSTPTTLRSTTLTTTVPIPRVQVQNAGGGGGGAHRRLPYPDNLSPRGYTPTLREVTRPTRQPLSPREPAPTSRKAQPSFLPPTTPSSLPPPPPSNSPSASKPNIQEEFSSPLEESVTSPTVFSNVSLSDAITYTMPDAPRIFVILPNTLECPLVR